MTMTRLHYPMKIDKRSQCERVDSAAALHPLDSFTLIILLRPFSSPRIRAPECGRRFLFAKEKGKGNERSLPIVMPRDTRVTDTGNDRGEQKYPPTQCMSDQVGVGVGIGVGSAAP